jgi:hypothetical protein
LNGVSVFLLIKHSSILNRSIISTINPLFVQWKKRRRDESISRQSWIKNWFLKWCCLIESYSMNLVSWMYRITKEEWADWNWDWIWLDSEKLFLTVTKCFNQFISSQE